MRRTLLTLVGMASILALAPALARDLKVSQPLMPSLRFGGPVPTIEYQPTPQTTILGGTARFTVIASGDAPLAYQWRKNGVDLADGGKVSGATADVLTLGDVRFDDAAAYSVVVTTTSDSTTSVDAALTVTVPQAGDVDHSFNAGSSVDEDVNAIVMQADDKVIIGGFFSSVDGVARGFVARLNADGTTDHTFGNAMAGTNDVVNALAIQLDGRVLVGGNFTTVNGTGRSRIARLNADGSLDTNFLNGLAGADNEVYCITVQPDGRVLVGGRFTTVNGVSRNRIARLNADGSLDTTFLNGLTGADSPPAAMAVESDGRVLIVGYFHTVNGVTRNGVARLNSDGSLDTTFQNGLTGANNTVWALAVQADGRALIGGAFNTVNGVTRRGIARLNADGSVDTTFLNGMQGAEFGVHAIAVQLDGRVVAGGEFTMFNSTTRNRVARLNANGSLDTAFLDQFEGVNDMVSTLALRPDGRVLVGGRFTMVNGSGRHHLAGLNADGSLDTTFVNGGGANDAIASFVFQPDGRLLVGGRFTAVHGVGRRGIARLNADFSLDTTFLNQLAGVNTSVAALALQPDGRVLVGGPFTTINDESFSYLARLNADGSLDTTFQNGLGGANNGVSAIYLYPDGRVLIGGAFPTINGISRNRIARLNADGSVDTTFLNGLTGGNGTVSSLAVQPDGKVVIGGLFTTFNGVSRTRIARLNTDGSVDTTFQNGLAGASSQISALALQPDGRVLIGGAFTTVNGVSRNRIARLNADGSLDTSFQNGLAGAGFPINSLALQPDGRVWIGGSFTTINGVNRTYVARLNSDGSLDTSVSTGLNSNVLSLALQPDGRVMISGFFTMINTLGRASIARLYGSAPVAPAIALQPSSQVSHDGSCAVFLVNATGTPLDYQWRRDGAALEDGPLLTGAHSPTLRLAGVSSSDQADYTAVVSNVLGELTSTDGTLTVTQVPPCRVATCDFVLGSVLSDLPDGTSCTDGMDCTTADHCSSGLCVGDGVTATFHRDVDGDRYGDPAVTTQACAVPSGYVSNPLDCDDADVTVRPGGLERCDGKRNDCLGAAWPALLDGDDDGLEDACEACVDGDGDGWGDPGAPGNLCAGDNCPSEPNPAQEDPDFDGIGTACDSYPLDILNDADGDGLGGNADNCPRAANSAQGDLDGDGLGDACDGCPGVSSRNNFDLDRDGTPDACDGDVDGDGILNGSDTDDDGDSVPDDDGDGVNDPCPDGVSVACDDDCPLDRNANQRDRDEDGIGDACDTADDLVGGVSTARGGVVPLDPYTISWDRDTGVLGYNVYAATLGDLRLGLYGSCYRTRIVTSYTTMDHVPASGYGVFYLVTPVSPQSEGSLGDRSNATERPLTGPCP